MNENSLLTDKTKIRNCIVNFKNDVDVQKLQSLYFSKSFSEILLISRREISHSSFIAWLLDDKESHLLSTFAIQKFFEIVFLRCKSNYLDDKYGFFINNILSDNYTIKSTTVEREKHFPMATKNQQENGRLDIYVEAIVLISNKEYTIRLIIENKVESNESGDQTDRYFRYFEEIKGQNFINIYVYLTAIPSLILNQITEPQCICKNFIQINYQDLVDKLFEPILNRSISERTRFIVSEYLHSLSHPALVQEVADNEEKPKQKQTLIMALGKEEKDLLSNFWRKNEKLIMAAMYAISTDDSQDEEVRETTGKALEVLSSRDHSTFILNYDGNIYEKDFKMSNVGYFTIRLLSEKGLINDAVFAFLREDKSCSFQLIKREDEVKKKSEFKKYRLNSTPELIYKGENYYVARNWGKVQGIDNTIKFIEKIKVLFPQITFERKN